MVIIRAHRAARAPPLPSFNVRRCAALPHILRKRSPFSCQQLFVVVSQGQSQTDFPSSIQYFLLDSSGYSRSPRCSIHKRARGGDCCPLPFDLPSSRYGTERSSLHPHHFAFFRAPPFSLLVPFITFGSFPFGTSVRVYSFLSLLQLFAHSIDKTSGRAHPGGQSFLFYGNCWAVRLILLPFFPFVYVMHALGFLNWNSNGNRVLPPPLATI